MKAFVRTRINHGPTRSVVEVAIVQWWQSLNSYNPPQRKLSLRHLKLTAMEARKTLCGVEVPTKLFPNPPTVSEFGYGHSDCKRCSRAGDTT